MSNRKVYSCSMFFNELELLELKLETLWDVVDYFVISESDTTHSGKPKDPIFFENRNRFKKYWDKIIYQAVRDTPSKYHPALEFKPQDEKYNIVVDRVNKGNWWNHEVESYGRDSYEKEALIRPLLGMAKDEDVILLSDLDEIVRPESFKSILENFDEDVPYHFYHDMFYYYLNLQKSEKWYGTIATSMKHFKEESFCHMRQVKSGHFVLNAGWHFTYQGGVEAIKTKIESFGEQSLNTEKIKNMLKVRVKNALHSGVDLYGRMGRFTVRDIHDGTFPEYLVKNEDKFKYMLYGGTE